MSYLPWIEADAVNFPETSNALEEPNGLLAAGGNLSPKQLLTAYRNGIFPWYEEDQPVLWWTPDPRLVLYPEDLHVSKSMAKLLRKKAFEVTTDQAFEEVMWACAALRRGGEGTWITEDIIEAYVRLHNMGIAHSVEVWEEGKLVGGLYGIALGKVYFGESMFSRTSNASKYGFIQLTRKLQKLGFGLIDCQIYSEHLASLGATEISRLAFEKELEKLRHNDAKSIWPTDLD